MRNVYLYLKEYNELIIETLKASNEQLISYESNGNVVVFKERVYEEFDYSSVIRLLEDDFNNSITLVVGGFNELVIDNISKLPSELYYFDDYLIYLTKKDLGDKIYKWLSSIDLELLKTIKSFIELDMSVNKTASKLYIHRNTLNYRLDKFEKLTNINVRTFKGSLSVYLILNFVQTTNS
ncbi:helix-turn-helix domain-containing protein [Mycoplasmatota bacterium WC44]